MKKPVGIVDQVRIALSTENRLATFVGMLLGAIVPLATYFVAHVELSAEWWTNPLTLLVAGGLLYSASTVYQWATMAVGSSTKALGFTVLIEGVMTCSGQEWLSIIALVYLCGINAIATGVTLARGSSMPTRRTEDVIESKPVALSPKAVKVRSRTKKEASVALPSAN